MRASFGRVSGLAVALLQSARCRVLWGCAGRGDDARANGPPGTQARSRSGPAVRNYRAPSASSAGAPCTPNGGACMGGRHATALVDGSARVHDTARVGPYAVILEGVTVGAGSVIEGHCVIGPHVVVGPQCRISSHVTVSHATLEDHVVLWPGVRIGQDGFGIHKYLYVISPPNMIITYVILCSIKPIIDRVSPRGTGSWWGKSRGGGGCGSGPARGSRQEEAPGAPRMDRCA
jgi:hypothetical protein